MSRPRVALALAGSAWALLTFPLVGAGWSWPWVDQLAATPVYRAIQQSVDDPYVVFGALGAVSFLAIGVALLPSMNRAGWGGRLFAWTVLAGALVTTLSYVGSPAESPLHVFWGSEAYALLALGIAGILAAITAGRQWPGWSRVLLACTFVVLVLGALALAYYPHGCLVTLGLASTALIVATPRAEPRSSHLLA